jgi:hypothetical protein
MDYFTRVLRSEIYLNKRAQHSLHLLHINIKELTERCRVICYYFKGVAIFWRFWPILAGTESRFFYRTAWRGIGILRSQEHLRPKGRFPCKNYVHGGNPGLPETR